MDAEKNSNWFSKIIRDEDHKIKKEYVTPISVEKDAEYKERLWDVMNQICQDFTEHNIDHKYIDTVRQYRGYFEDILFNQYSGNIADAQKTADFILDDLLQADENVAVSPINRSLAFIDIEEIIVGSEFEIEPEIDFYRARTSNTYIIYEREEMLHVSFDKRQIISNARFSISGFPCLYLGSSSYCCWLELNTPEPQHFNVSYVAVNGSNQILNLTMNASDFECFVALGSSEKKLLTALKIWLLNIATSFHVKDQNRLFKSEYIISQLLMLSSKNYGLYGVSYYSKRVEDDRFADHVCANLAIFALYNNELKLSEICRDIKITKSMNYEMFKNLPLSQKYRRTNLNVSDSSHIINIGNFERQYPYHETEFYAFDQYLKAHLANELRAVDIDKINSRENAKK